MDENYYAQLYYIKTYSRYQPIILPFAIAAIFLYNQWSSYGQTHYQRCQGTQPQKY